MRVYGSISAFALFGFVAIGGATPPGRGQAIADSVVTIQTFQFRPKQLVVPQGTRVLWTNADDIEHTVTSGVPDSSDGQFGATLARVGATFGFTFTRVGTYHYFCARHQFMRGEIRVTQPGDS